MSWRLIDRMESAHRISTGARLDEAVLCLGFSIACMIFVAGQLSRRYVTALTQILRDSQALTDQNRLLKASEERSRELFESHPDPMYLFDNETHEILDVNPAALALYGYSRDEFLKLTARDLRPSEDVPQFVTRVLSAGRDFPDSVNWRHLTRDGTVLYVEVAAFGHVQHGREVTMVAVKDVTQKVQQQNALAKSEASLRSFVMDCPNGIYRSYIDPPRFESVNPALSRMLGYDNPEQVMALNFPEEVYADPSDRERVIKQLLECGKVKRFPTAYKKKDGSLARIMLSGELCLDEAGWPNAFEGYVTDVTEQYVLEEQLRQAQKMEAIGRLAGGVAHDFNNLLLAIRGSAELLQMKLGAGPHERHTEDIIQASDRAAKVTHQLLAFSRKQVLKPVVLNVNNTLAEIRSLLSRLLGEDVRVREKLSPDLWNTKVDPSQLTQVVLNLAVNARDAMPNGGVLNVETANVTCAPNDICVDSRAGQYVRISVRDSGMGMDPYTASHAFEPFFTTKSFGTGLGLATVYGIVKQSCGYITVNTRPGEGCEFAIFLPRSAASTAPKTSSAKPRKSALKTRETLLIVEDDEHVREPIVAYLSAQGYIVLVAGCGEDGLAVMTKQGNQVSLVVTDLVMPGMNGAELADECRKRWPSIPVVLMSGYSEHPLLSRTLELPGVTFLQKPFGMAELDGVIRRELDAHATTSAQ